MMQPLPLTPLTTITIIMMKMASKVLSSNDLAKKGSNFFRYVAIRFPHIEMFSFSQIQ